MSVGPCGRFCWRSTRTTNVHILDILNSIFELYFRSYIAHVHILNSTFELYFWSYIAHMHILIFLFWIPLGKLYCPWARFWYFLNYVLWYFEELMTWAHLFWRERFLLHWWVSGPSVSLYRGFAFGFEHMRTFLQGTQVFDHFAGGVWRMGIIWWYHIMGPNILRWIKIMGLAILKEFW